MTAPDSTPFVTHSEFGAFRDVVGQRFDNVERGMASQHRETMEAIKELRATTATKATDWKGVAGVAFGAFGVVVAFLAIYVRPVEAAIDAHLKEPGHPQAMQLHAAYGERFETIAADVTSNRADIGEVEERFEKWNYRLTEQHDQATAARAALSERVARLEAMSGEWGDAREERHNLEARVRALEVNP